MNDFSLYENVPIRNQEIKAITNQGCLIESDNAIRWLRVNGEKSDSIKLDPKKIIPTQNGEFAVLAANSKLYFLPANHTNCFYDIEVNSLDITDAKCIKIWCQNLPKCSAVVSILTREKIICYLFENDETIRFEQPFNGVENLTFTRSDYFYAWNSKKIFRFKISKNGLRIFRKIENLVSAEILKLVSAPKFLIAQTDSKLVTICNSSGLILSEKIMPALKNVDISKILDELYLTVVSNNSVEIFKVDQFGKNFELVWKIKQNGIECCDFGSSATIYKNEQGFNWVTRLSPEEKLERLVARGDLSLAARFAEKHCLNSDLIHRAEMRNEISRATDFPKIKELIEKIGDIDFIAEIAAEVKNPNLKKALLEVCAEISAEDDDITEEIAQNSLDEINSISCEGLEQLAINLISKKDLIGLSNLCHSENYKLTSESCRRIVGLLPSSSAEDVIVFLKSILPLFSISAVTVAGDEMAQWVASRAVAFADSDKEKWPQNAIDVIDAFQNSCSLKNENETQFSGNEVMLQRSLSQLVEKLREIKTFKNEFDIQIPLSVLDDTKKKADYLTKLIQDRLTRARSVQECDRVLTRTVLPIITRFLQPIQVLTVDEFLSDFLDMAEKYPLECQVILIRHISTIEKQKKKLRGILQDLNYPWPRSLRDFASSLL